MKTPKLPKKFKTLKAIWLYIAATWDNPVCNLIDEYEAYTVPGLFSSGICGSISRLNDVGYISTTQERSLMKRLQKHPNRESCLYLWPRTLEGAKERAAFCRAQARRCR